MMIKHDLDPGTDTLHVAIMGDLISTTVDQISSDLAFLEKNGPSASEQWTTLNLDLEKARMVDSMGLNLLVNIIKIIQKRGASLITTIRSRTIHRTLLATRLDKFMEIKLLD